MRKDYHLGGGVVHALQGIDLDVPDGSVDVVVEVPLDSVEGLGEAAGVPLEAKSAPSEGNVPRCPTCGRPKGRSSP